MTGDDIVRRAGDHLERTVDRVLDEERQPPEATRVTVADFDGGGDINHDHVEIDCDICEDNLAIAPGLDGWKTQEQHGPSEQPHREHIGHYVPCTPCKESWERADYNELYSRSSFSDRVDDLAQLAGDTIRIPDRERRDGGLRLRPMTAALNGLCVRAAARHS